MAFQELTAVGAAKVLPDTLKTSISICEKTILPASALCQVDVEPKKLKRLKGESAVLVS